MKNINDLTIKEYKLFEELVKDSNILGVFELFKVDISDMSILDMNTKFMQITSMPEIKYKIEKTYYIGKRKYKPQLNLAKIKAAQFIDFQSYMSGDRRMEQILSVFLIPMHRQYGIWREGKYNEYDMAEVQEEIANNFRISDARALSDFFFHLSISLLQVLKDSSMKAEVKKKMRKK